MADPQNSSRPPLRTGAADVELAGERLTVQGLADADWLPLMRTRLRASTFDSYRRNLELHVYPALGDLQVGEVTPGHLNSLYSRLLVEGNRRNGGGLNRVTVRYIHVILHGLLDYAMDIGLVSFNPATRSRPPRSEWKIRATSRSWTELELGAFLRFIEGERDYVAFHLAAMTGMRRGEILGLHRPEVNLPGRRLAIRRTLVSIGYEVAESIPKGASTRSVTIDATTTELLRRHLEVRAELDETDGFVFTDAAGRRLHPDLFTQRFSRLVARSGLPRVRFHDLRHTHASIGLAAGVPVWVMSERLGHSRPEYTLSQYAHVLPGMQESAAQLVADRVAGR